MRIFYVLYYKVLMVVHLLKYYVSQICPQVLPNRVIFFYEKRKFRRLDAFVICMLKFSPFAFNLRRLTSTMTPLKLNLIAACDSKQGIGVKNTLPWRLKNEMAHFNRMTTGCLKSAGSTSGESKKNVVVMGRKTWDSIPTKFRPLKNRLNIILSRTIPAEQEKGNDELWVTNWDEMVEKLNLMQAQGEIDKIWIVGGSYMYKLALESPLCHRIYLTRIQNDYGCDVFFPDFDLDTYQLVKDPDVPDEEQEETDVKYNFLVYEKI